MRIICPLLLLLSTLALTGCQSKAEKIKQLQDQCNAECSAYAKACLDEDTSGAARTSDRREADRGADSGPRSQEEGTKRTVHSQRPTVLHRSREKSVPHSSNAVSL